MAGYKSTFHPTLAVRDDGHITIDFFDSQAETVDANGNSVELSSAHATLLDRVLGVPVGGHPVQQAEALRRLADAIEHGTHAELPTGHGRVRVEAECVGRIREEWLVPVKPGDLMRLGSGELDPLDLLAFDGARCIVDESIGDEEDRQVTDWHAI